jgi:hypothetical protein
MPDTFLKNNKHLIESMSVRMVHSNAVSQSPYTLQQQVQSFGGMRWEVDVSLKPLNNADALAVQAFFVKLKGRKESFEVPMVHSYNENHSVSITGVTVNGNQSTGDSTFAVTTSTAIPAGRMFSIGGRVYMNTNTSGTGNVTLDIIPPLRTNVSDNATVFFNPAGTFRLDTDEVAWGISNDLKYGFSFTCVEAIDG